MPMIFKLKGDHGDCIVGCGTFVRHDRLPVWLAWEAFETRNGAADYASFRRQLEVLRG